MKKLLTIFAMAAVLCAVSCKKQDQPEPDDPATPETPEVVEVTGVSLNKTTLALKVGETSQLVAEVLPENADNKDIEWSVDKNDVVSVDAGLVTALKEGTAVVTVTTNDGGKTATCEVTVTKEGEEILGPDSVVIDSDEYELNVGQEYDMFPYDLFVTGQADANLEVVWTSTDSEVAVVENNKIIAKKFGTTTIRAAAKYGDKYDQCVVKVYDLPTDIAFYIGETEIRTANAPYYFEVGDEFTVTAKILPETAKQDAWYFTYDPNQDILQNDGVNPTFKVVKSGTVEIDFISEFGGGRQSIPFETEEPLKLEFLSTSSLTCTDKVYSGGSSVMESNTSISSVAVDNDKSSYLFVPESDSKGLIFIGGSYSTVDKGGLVKIVDKEVTMTATDIYSRTAEQVFNVKGWSITFADSETNSAIDLSTATLKEGQKIAVILKDVDLQPIDLVDFANSSLAFNVAAEAYSTSITKINGVNVAILQVKSGAPSYDIIIYNSVLHNYYNGDFSKSTVKTYSVKGM